MTVIKAKKKLTRKEKILVAGVLGGKSQTQAAIDAGYSEKTATVQASQVLTKLNVRELIESKANRALEVIDELMNNIETPANVRMIGAKDILDRSGFKPKEQVELKATINEMTAEQRILIANRIIEQGKQSTS